MHPKVKKIVKRIWENRLKILFDEDTTTGHSDTIEDRCYTYYASSTPIGEQAIASKTLDLTKLDGIAADCSCTYSDQQKGTFRHYLFDNREGTVKTRIYINAKPQYAAAICMKLFTLFGADWRAKAATEVPARQPRYGRVLGTTRQPQPQHVPVLVRTNYFAGKAWELKVAEGKEAFTSRRDKIVVFATVNFDEAVAIARSLNITIDYLDSKVPLMTLKVSHGVAVGADLHGKQEEAGLTFGGGRCNLIAKALLQVCTGKSDEEFIAHYRYYTNESDRYCWIETQDSRRYYTKEGASLSSGAKWKASFVDNICSIKAPISKHRNILLNPGPSLDDFENRVSELFREFNIDPDAPWK